MFGGGGLANGFGGPVAPALSNALAEGDGGGNTTPECESVRSLAGVALGPLSCADPVPPSSSDASDGICTFNLGRAPPFDPLVSLLEGGANSDALDCVLGCGMGLGALLGGALISAEPSRFIVLGGASLKK